MVMNLLVVVFILLMAYWWSLQGLFSSWLHLGLLIVSGAIALAAWEPMAYWLLGTGSFATINAWGVALLAPFGVALILLRFATDKLVPKNMHFPDLANKIGGAVVGVFSGVLTAGIVVMGLNFMALGQDVAGYEPYTIGTNGRITPNEKGQLWLSVDKIAAAFFRKLSGGAFSAGNPMDIYLPDMAQTAGVFRLHIDPHASIVAVPNAVTITGAYSQPVPLAELDETIQAEFGEQLQPGKQIVVIDTKWLATPRGTFDGDGMLRLPPVHLSLVTTRGNNVVTQHIPIALSRAEREGPRSCMPVRSPIDALTSNRNEEQIAITFLIDSEERPQYLFARRLRLPVPTLNTEAQNVVAMVGAIPAKPDPADAATAQRGGPTRLEHRAAGTIKTGIQGVELENNPMLPLAISKNMATAFEYYSDTNDILNGSREVAKFPGNVTQKLKVDRLYEAPSFAIIRLKLDRDASDTFLGRARALAAGLNPPVLQDNFGRSHYAIGYVLKREGDTQLINIDRHNEIRAASQLPIRQMNAGDELYLYFNVPRESGRRITGFEIGPMKQEALEEGMPVE